MSYVDPNAVGSPYRVNPYGGSPYGAAPQPGPVYVPGLGVVQGGHPAWIPPASQAYAPLARPTPAPFDYYGAQTAAGPFTIWNGAAPPPPAEPYPPVQAYSYPAPQTAHPVRYAVSPTDRSMYEPYWYDEAAFAEWESAHPRTAPVQTAPTDNWLANFMMPIMYFGDHLFMGFPHEISAGIAGLTGIFSEEGFGGRRDRVRDMLLDDMRAYELADPAMAAALRVAGDVPLYRAGPWPGAIEEVTYNQGTFWDGLYGAGQSALTDQAFGGFIHDARKYLESLPPSAQRDFLDFLMGVGDGVGPSLAPPAQDGF